MAPFVRRGGLVPRTRSSAAVSGRGDGSSSRRIASPGPSSGPRDAASAERRLRAGRDRRRELASAPARRPRRSRARARPGADDGRAPVELERAGPAWRSRPPGAPIGAAESRSRRAAQIGPRRSPRPATSARSSSAAERVGARRRAVRPESAFGAPSAIADARGRAVTPVQAGIARTATAAVHLAAHVAGEVLTVTRAGPGGLRPAAVERSIPRCPRRSIRCVPRARVGQFFGLLDHLQRASAAAAPLTPDGRGAASRYWDELGGSCARRSSGLRRARWPSAAAVALGRWARRRAGGGRASRCVLDDRAQRGLAWTAASAGCTGSPPKVPCTAARARRAPAASTAGAAAQARARRRARPLHAPRVQSQRAVRSDLLAAGIGLLPAVRRARRCRAAVARRSVSACEERRRGTRTPRPGSARQPSRASTYRAPPRRGSTPVAPSTVEARRCGAVGDRPPSDDAAAR